MKRLPVRKDVTDAAATAQVAREEGYREFLLLGATGGRLDHQQGAFLLAAGTPGKRFALPNSEIMIHQPLGGMQGQATDIKIHADRIIKIKETLNKILSERTGKPLEIIQRDTERDNFMTADEAMEYGLIDKVLRNRQDK